jgi:hypothetical protein
MVLGLKASREKVGTGFSQEAMRQPESIARKSGNRFFAGSDAATRKHRAKKWEPVFRRKRCGNQKASREKVGTGFSQEATRHAAIAQCGGSG